MGLQPKIERKSAFTLKQCSRCHQSFGPENFAPTKSIFFADGVLPICNDCIDSFLADDVSWAKVNKLCQMGDIPFIPAEWEKVYEMNPTNAFARYATIFLAQEYEDLGWQDYYDTYQKLKEANLLERELPGLAEDKLHAQRERWGGNYDPEALDYLDGLFNGLMATQNVNGALQMDQAIKICKLSYEIDCRIREGSDFDKALSAYDKLVKTAEFTPKNVKNLNDFDTTGEVIRWLEKRGWHNQYYDGVSRDIVDETMKNIQLFNQRLYTNESGIGDEISHRIEQLKSVKANVDTNQSDDYFLNSNQSYDLDNYENDGYEKLLGNQPFDPNA